MTTIIITIAAVTSIKVEQRRHLLQQRRWRRWRRWRPWIRADADRKSEQITWASSQHGRRFIERRRGVGLALSVRFVGWNAVNQRPCGPEFGGQWHQKWHWKWYQILARSLIKLQSKFNLKLVEKIGNWLPLFTDFMGGIGLEIGI